ncbi:MFS transporter [Streptomyces sp. NPDC047009]|uniref:MFS transporter n=1 Tax=Streptomyces sp. NPDC047009 TaxID=3154496 RepID=UPI0033DD9E07
MPAYGTRVPHAGLGVLLAGVLAAVAVYAVVPAGRHPWALLPVLAVCGLGQGLFAVPFFTTALQRVRSHETGSAAGLLNAVRQLGSTLGSPCSAVCSSPGAPGPRSVRRRAAGATWMAGALMTSGPCGAGRRRAARRALLPPG